MRNEAIRPAAAAVALLVATALLAGCGGSDEDGSAAPPPGEATTTGSEDPGGDSAAGGAGDTAGGESTAGGEGTDGDGGRSDAERVEAAIEAVLADEDNQRVCGELLSDSLLGSAYGDLQGCVDGRRPVTLADGIDRVRSLEVEGDAATATVVPDGGLYDGIELEVGAVREGDEWRIDRLVADVPVGP